MSAEAYVKWEPDPRHVEILAAGFGLTEQSKALSTPGVRMPKTADTTLLSAADKEQYRSSTMRLAYLALDRPELQYPSKELARSMQEPNRWFMEQLKQAVRSLAVAPRLVQRFTVQGMPGKVTQ